MNTARIPATAIRASADVSGQRSAAGGPGLWPVFSNGCRGNAPVAVAGGDGHAGGGPRPAPHASGYATAQPSRPGGRGRRPARERQTSTPAATAPLACPWFHWTSEPTVKARTTISAASDRLAAAASPAAAGRHGRIARPDRDRRRQVADVPGEGDGLSLFAGCGQRREHVGGRGDHDERAEHPKDRLAPPPDRQHAHREHPAPGSPATGSRTTRGARAQNQSPHARCRASSGTPRSRAEAGSRAPEPAARSAPPSRRRGSGCRPRSGFGRTSSRRSASIGIHSARRRSRVVRGAITITATVSAATGARNESLIPGGKAGRDPGGASAAARSATGRSGTPPAAPAA